MSRLDPYSIDKLSKIKPGLKVYFIKFWVFGASFLLAMMALPQRFDFLDRLVILILLITLASEYITNIAIRFMHREEAPTLKYLTHPFDSKKWYSIFLTLIYAAILTLATHFIIDFYVKIGGLTIGDLISESTADPFSFAILFIFLDLLYVFIKDFFMKIKKGKNDV